MSSLIIPNRSAARCISALVVLVVLSPVLENCRDRPRDGFPLSYYPMFSEKRRSNMRVTYLIGLDAAGNRHKVPYVFAGSGGLNQVRKQIAAKVRRGEAAELCGKVAHKLAQDESQPYADLIEISIVAGKYSLDGYFTGERAPLDEVVYASCPIPRRTP